MGCFLCFNQKWKLVPLAHISISQLQKSLYSSTVTDYSPLQMPSKSRTDLLNLGWLKIQLSKVSPTAISHLHTDRDRIAGLKLNGVLYNSQLQPICFLGREVCAHLNFARIGVQINENHLLCSCFHELQFFLNPRLLNSTICISPFHKSVRYTP